MSQVNTASGATLKNTAWNRTPGKPSIGTTSGNSSATNLNRWSSSYKSANGPDNPHMAEPLHSHVEVANKKSESNQQMWPSTLFDASNGPSDLNIYNSTSTTIGAGSTNSLNQWPALPSSSSPSNIQAGPCGDSAISSTSTGGMSVPRAITGQQMQSQTRLNIDADPTARYLTGSTTSNTWSLTGGTTDSIDSMNADRLSFNLSKMHVGSGISSSGGYFRPIQDFVDRQLLPGTSSASSGNVRSVASPLDTNPVVSQQQQQSSKHLKSSTENCSDQLGSFMYSSEPEDAVRCVVNTTEAWGVTPVDQSIPWDTSELASVGSLETTGSPSAVTSGVAPGLFESGRRIGSAMNMGPLSTGELESNVWPSEPPNGTSIWETHYENLGERTARWQQQQTTASLSIGGPSGSKPFLPPSTDGLAYRGNSGFNRPAPNLFPSASGTQKSHLTHSGGIPGSSNPPNRRFRIKFPDAQGDVPGSSNPSNIPEPFPVTAGDPIDQNYSGFLDRFIRRYPATFPERFGSPSDAASNMTQRSRMTFPDANSSDSNRHFRMEVNEGGAGEISKSSNMGNVGEPFRMLTRDVDQSDTGIMEGDLDRARRLFPDVVAAFSPHTNNMVQRPRIDLQGSGMLHGSSNANNMNRRFRMDSPDPVNRNAGGAMWPFTPPVSTDPLGSKSGRWPNNPSYGRITGKQTGQLPPHLLAQQPGFTGTGMRWPPSNSPVSAQLPGGWPITDPRRPNHLLPPGGTSGWTNPPTGDNYFGPQMFPPPAAPMCQTGGPYSDFTTPPLLPNMRTGGLPTHHQPQAFCLPPQSAFYPTTSPSGAQRMFRTPQQHSHQLQQQSMLRANAMRQLVNLGFPDEEIQNIFSDLNTDVERSLIDLRDRTGHPGLDELIKSFANIGLTPNMDDMTSGMDLSTDQQQLSGSIGGMRPITMVRPNPMEQQQQQHAGNLPMDNIEFSLQMLEQRESQILQTIMQLHSKHQELNQKLGHIRSTNLSHVATNPVFQELKMQAIQVGSQIDAQHAQLKQVRSQAGMLKQITVASGNLSQPPPPAPIPASNPPNISNPSAFNLLSSTINNPNAHWPSSTATTNPPSTSPPGALDVGGLCTQHSSQFALSDNLGSDPDSGSQDHALKMGTGSGGPSSFLWDSSPWSGTSQQQQQQPRSNLDPFVLDRQWAMMNLQSPDLMAALSDPRWSTDVIGGSGDAMEHSLSSLPHSDQPLSTSGGSPSSWLLVHNIPPHVSVGVLKLAISTTLNKISDSGEVQSQQDFELHPNMSANWVLIGLSSVNDSVIVQDYLEGPASEATGMHYGSVKAITPADALVHLQEIQSLASRFKSVVGSYDTTPHPASQPSTLVNAAGDAP